MLRTWGVRRTRTRRVADPILPEELVVWEILIRLSAKSLLRCRAVCRSWRRRTSAPDFILAHHRRQPPPLPLVSFHGQPFPAPAASGSRRTLAAVDAFDLQRSPPPERRRHPVLRFDDYNRHRHFWVHASCDGLLLLSLSNNRYYIRNPATRRWAALPQLTGTDGAALYSHSSSSGEHEHRVLYWKGRYTAASRVVYRVLTVGGSSARPRRVDLAVAAGAAAPLVARGWLHVSNHPPVLLHGCLHWLLHCSPEKALVVFDTAAESFRSMRSPIAAGWSRLPRLFEMDGTLGISRVNESKTAIKLWVLQDYATEVWSLKYRIKLPVLQLRRIAKDWSLDDGMVVSENGDVLVTSLHSSHLFLCDRKGKLLDKFSWDRESPTPTGHWFRESLVWHHEFLERQDGGRVRWPRFFKGL